MLNHKQKYQKNIFYKQVDCLLQVSFSATFHPLAAFDSAAFDSAQAAAGEGLVLVQWLALIIRKTHDFCGIKFNKFIKIHFIFYEILTLFFRVRINRF